MKDRKEQHPGQNETVSLDSVSVLISLTLLFSSSKKKSKKAKYRGVGDVFGWSSQETSHRGFMHAHATSNSEK